jgi:serine/threonine protein kinase
MPLQPGQVLNNRYRIVRLLGQGGFGAVYRAWDTNLNRPCAVKENLDTSSEAQRQFTREATVLANLSHPNLTRVTDHFILPDQGQYLVMDFVEGDDLASMMKRDGIFPVDKAIMWITQVADALIYLHARQPPVLHRDIKPSNIRVTPEGHAMLVDFGLVKLYDPNLKTTMGARAVTPGYAPPEQYGRGSTDSRTDQYALGATLYNMLTGQEPFESVQRLSGRVMPLAHQLNPRVPAYVGAAIERSMSLEPSQRFPSVTEFKKALTTPPAAGTVVTPAHEAVQPSPQGYAALPRYSPPPAYASPQYAKPSASAQPTPPTYAVPERQMPAYPRVAQPPAARSAKPKSIPVNRTGLWLGLAALAVLCLVGVIVVSMWAANQQDSAAKRTSDAQLQQTLEERVRLTSTYQAQATQTAGVYAESTAQVQATEQALTNFLARLESSKVLVYGPANGELPHDPSNTLIESRDAGVNLQDFIVEARFQNPYAASSNPWDYGFILRHETKNTQFRFVIKSNKTWSLTNHNNDPDGQVIASGELPGLNVDENGQNLIKLVFQGGRGLFYLEGTLISELDLSMRTNPGSIYIVTGVYQGDEIANAVTRYSGFTIWSLP